MDTSRRLEVFASGIALGTLRHSCAMEGLDGAEPLQRRARPQCEWQEIGGVPHSLGMEKGGLGLFSMCLKDLERFSSQTQGDALDVKWNIINRLV